MFPDLKTCTACQQSLPRDQFSRGKGYRDGLKSWCKTCSSIKERERKDRDLETARAKARDAQARFRRTERGRESRKAYEQTAVRKAYVRKWKREAHRKSREGKPDGRRKPIPTEKACTICGQTKPISGFYLNIRNRPMPECKDCAIQRSRSLAEKNRTGALKRMRDWYEANKHTEAFKAKRRENGRVWDAKKRARKLSAPGSGISRPEWEARLEWFNHSCLYCGATGVKLTLDHVEPLARGGWDTPSNAVPACVPCNASKNDRFLLEWLWARADEKQPALRV